MPPGENTRPDGRLEILLVPGLRGLAAAQYPGAGALHDLALGREFMREARRLGDLGLDLLALEQKLQRVAGRQQARHALRAAAAGKQAHLDLRQAHLGFVIVGEDAVMTGERQLESAAEAHAVDRDGEGFA